MDTIKRKLSATASPQVRSGTWTKQEEDYVQALIQEFRDGHLPLNEGTSLRGFLAKMLDCKPKRISKKYGKTDYKGAHLYTKSDTPISAQEMEERHRTLKTLEIKFRESLAAQTNEASFRVDGMGGGSLMTSQPGTTSSLFSPQQAYLMVGLQQQQEQLRSAARFESLGGLGGGGNSSEATALDLLGLAQAQPFAMQQRIRERVLASMAMDSLRSGHMGSHGNGSLHNMLASQYLRDSSTAAPTATAQSLLAAGLPDRLGGLAAGAPASSMRDLLMNRQRQSSSPELRALLGGGPSSELERLLLLQRATEMPGHADNSSRIRQALAFHPVSGGAPASSNPGAASLLLRRAAGEREGPSSDLVEPETKRPRLGL